MKSKKLLNGELKINIIRKANKIPFQGRKQYSTLNTSPILLSSTNYSNTISNSFKDDLNINIIKSRNYKNNNLNFNSLKNKFVKTKERTKKLFELIYELSIKNNNAHIDKPNKKINEI